MDRKVISAADVTAAGAGRSIVVAPTDLVTPLALELAEELGVTIERSPGEGSDAGSPAAPTAEPADSAAPTPDRALPIIPAPADPSPKVPPTRTPADSWAALRAGNTRFLRGRPTHPDQTVDRRRELAASQHPHTVIIGCSDSRVPPELVFDQGLGDVFVIRSAGHVLDAGVIGSLEYGTAVLGASLVVVLGHESCGAIAATVHTLATGEEPPGLARAVVARAVVDRVIPSIVAITSTVAAPAGDPVTAAVAGSRSIGAQVFDPDSLRTAHVRYTVDRLAAYSPALRQGLRTGALAIVGAEYALEDGTVRVVEVLGDIGEEPRD